MKKITSLLIIAISILQLGCSGDDTFDNKFYPRIFDNGNTFTSPNRIVSEGEPVNYGMLSFSPSPSRGMEISWKVDGVHVSSDTAFVFNPPAGGGEFEISLEASYKGQSSKRISKVLVSPSSYTPKLYDHIALSYLTENGNATHIDWAQVSHVAFNGARVLPEGTVDFSKGDLNQVTDELVARAHIHGVPFLLSVSGRLSGVDGWSLYNNTDFGSVISDPIMMPQLVSSLAAYVTAKRIDGVDILMTDLSNDDYGISARNAAAVAPFIRALKAALPSTAIVTATVTTNYLHWEYTDLSVADWIHVRAFENGLHVGPGAALGQSSPMDFLISSANIWLNKGYPAAKLVLGIPAFGVRYDRLDANGNNQDWGSYGYMPFVDILNASSDEQAYSKDFLPSVASGVYYNGTELVKQKAAYIKSNGFKGAYLWAGDYDVRDARSLMNSIKATLGE